MTNQSYWIRPTALVVAVIVHGAMLTGFAWIVPNVDPALPSVEVSVVASGEPVTETNLSPTPDAAPLIGAEPISATSTPMESAIKSASEQADVLDKSPIAPAQLQAPVLLKNVDAPAFSDIVPMKAQGTLSAARKAKRDLNDEEFDQAGKHSLAASDSKSSSAQARQIAPKPQHGAPATRAGALDGTGIATTSARSSYGALVSAEINRHKIYPERAQNKRATGRVSILFAVGAMGEMLTYEVIGSSGSEALDAAAKTMIEAARLPPPPGGEFRGTIVIHFDL